MTDKPTNIDRGAPPSAAPLSIVKPNPVLVTFATIALVAGLAVGVLSGAVIEAPTSLNQTVALSFFAVTTGIAASGLARSYPHAVLGLCNAVTLVRLALASVLVGVVFAPEWAAWPIFAIAAVTFAMDGLDGYLARRAGLSSAFGARFDMEVDSILALTLAVLAFQSGAAGPYVLLLGLPRYAFGAAQLFLPWLTAELPPRFSRKVVCVVQIAALLLMVFPPVGSPLTNVVAAVAALALIWSFWRDVTWLRQAASA